MSDVGSRVMSKIEQRINLKFLAKLGKNQHEAYHLLKKVYKDRCMSRVNAVTQFNEYRKSLEQPSDDGSEIEDEDMDNNAEGTSSSNASANTHRARSNSVIDSIGYRKYSAVLTATRVRSRSKSLSTTDYYTPLEVYTAVHGQCTANSYKGPSIEIEKKSDTIDAKPSPTVENINDNTCIKKGPSIPVALMPVSKDASCYNMNHKNRGKCIIFNHETFDLSFDKREGSTLDAERLQKTFGKLGFDVETHNNLTHSEIMDHIDRVSQLDHTDNDCLCIITLTHGIQNDLICAKDVVYSSDKLWKPFAGDKCKTLAGKPKLFFIQACRGNDSDSGVILSPRSLIHTETDSAASYVIPTHADFLIAHSSIQGFFTWRNPLQGTWYIQCLCDVLDEHGTEMELIGMLTLTSRKVATEFSSVSPDDLTLHEKKQVPSVTTMLLRYLYFPPKK